MPAQALIHWDGLVASVAPHGGLDLVVADGGASLLHGLEVVFDEPWVRGPATVTADELEQRWGLGSVTAVVRQRFDANWTLRVDVRNHASAPVQVPGCRLLFHSSWPVHEWFAGARAALLFETPGEPGTPDLTATGESDSTTGQGVPAQQLALVQVRGEARLDAAGRWLCGPVLLLGPADSPAASHSASWRSRWCASPTDLAGTLPSWWPGSTALTAGDDVALNLPDAALSSSTVALDRVSAAGAVLMAAAPGVHLVAVHESRGTTDLELAWAVPTEVELARRASRILDSQDARRARWQQAWLVDRASARRLVSQDDATSYLLEFCDRHATLPPSPQLAALLIHQASRTGDRGQTAAALAAVDSLPLQVGVWTGWLAGLACAQASGFRAPGPPAGRLPSDPVQSALAQVELESVEAQVSGALPSALVHRVARLLGPSLPGLVASALVSAQVWHLTGLLPEQWELDQGWPVTLGARRDEVERQLVAATCDDETLGWLVW